MRLRSRKKYTSRNEGRSLTRVKSVADTLAEIIPICQRIGVTRISDITFLDRLYIPNYSVVLPGTEDLFWVYSGKGPTKLHAKASGLMEAIERFCSLPATYPRAYIRGSYWQLSDSYDNVLHPLEVVEPLKPEYDDRDSILDYLPGFDLLNNVEILVPAEIVLYRYFPQPPATGAFSVAHTNGLASGNVLEEAVCHALCEVIERDAVSIADLAASTIPYNILERIIFSVVGEEGNNHLRSVVDEKFVDDSSIFPDVDISDIAEEFETIQNLVRRFTTAGLSLLIKDITQKDIGIPSFVASCVEWMSQNYGYFAKGYGSHPDSRVALIRAITELSQTRAVNIQGARDDLKKIQYKENDEIYKRKWQFMPTSADRNRKNMIAFHKIKSHTYEDVLDDIDLMVTGLKKAGLNRIIVVDLTSPSIGIPVVRVIVPGLETFEVTHSVMSGRAKQYFNRRHYSK